MCVCVVVCVYVCVYVCMCVCVGVCVWVCVSVCVCVCVCVRVRVRVRVRPREVSLGPRLPPLVPETGRVFVDVYHTFPQTATWRWDSDVVALRPTHSISDRPAQARRYDLRPERNRRRPCLGVGGSP